MEVNKLVFTDDGLQGIQVVPTENEDELYILDKDMNTMASFSADGVATGALRIDGINRNRISNDEFKLGALRGDSAGVTMKSMHAHRAYLTDTTVTTVHSGTIHAAAITSDHVSVVGLRSSGLVETNEISVSDTASFNDVFISVAGVTTLSAAVVDSNTIDIRNTLTSGVISSNHATIADITSVSGTFANLSVEAIDTENVHAGTISVMHALNAKSIDVASMDARSASMSDMHAGAATFHGLQADSARISTLTAEAADVTDLIARDNVTFLDNIHVMGTLTLGPDAIIVPNGGYGVSKLDSEKVDTNLLCVGNKDDDVCLTIVDDEGIRVMEKSTGDAVLTVANTFVAIQGRGLTVSGEETHVRGLGYTEDAASSVVKKNDRPVFETDGFDTMVLGGSKAIIGHVSDGSLGAHVATQDSEIVLNAEDTHNMGNLHVRGNLIVEGEYELIESLTKESDRLEVTNLGTGDALILNQSDSRYAALKVPGTLEVYPNNNMRYTGQADFEGTLSATHAEIESIRGSEASLGTLYTASLDSSSAHIEAASVASLNADSITASMSTMNALHADNLTSEFTTMSDLFAKRSYMSEATVTHSLVAAQVHADSIYCGDIATLNDIHSRNVDAASLKVTDGATFTGPVHMPSISTPVAMTGATVSDGLDVTGGIRTDGIHVSDAGVSSMNGVDTLRMQNGVVEIDSVSVNLNANVTNVRDIRADGDVTVSGTIRGSEGLEMSTYITAPTVTAGDITVQNNLGVSEQLTVADALKIQPTDDMSGLRIVDTDDELANIQLKSIELCNLSINVIVDVTPGPARAFTLAKASTGDVIRVEGHHMDCKIESMFYLDADGVKCNSVILGDIPDESNPTIKLLFDNVNLKYELILFVPDATACLSQFQIYSKGTIYTKPLEQAPAKYENASYVDLWDFMTSSHSIVISKDGNISNDGSVTAKSFMLKEDAGLSTDGSNTVKLEAPNGFTVEADTGVDGHLSSRSLGVSGVLSADGVTMTSGTVQTEKDVVVGGTLSAMSIWSANGVHVGSRDGSTPGVDYMQNTILSTDTLHIDAPILTVKNLETHMDHTVHGSAYVAGDVLAQDLRAQTGRFIDDVTIAGGLTVKDGVVVDQGIVRMDDFSAANPQIVSVMGAHDRSYSKYKSYIKLIQKPLSHTGAMMVSGVLSNTTTFCMCDITVRVGVGGAVDTQGRIYGDLDKEQMDIIVTKTVDHAIIYVQVIGQYEINLNVYGSKNSDARYATEMTRTLTRDGTVTYSLTADASLRIDEEGMMKVTSVDAGTMSINGKPLLDPSTGRLPVDLTDFPLNGVFDSSDDTQMTTARRVNITNDLHADNVVVTNGTVQSESIMTNQVTLNNNSVIGRKITSKDLDGTVHKPIKWYALCRIEKSGIDSVLQAVNIVLVTPVGSFEVYADQGQYVTKGQGAFPIGVLDIVRVSNSTEDVFYVKTKLLEYDMIVNVTTAQDSTLEHGDQPNNFTDNWESLLGTDTVEDGVSLYKFSSKNTYVNLLSVLSPNSIVEDTLTHRFVLYKHKDTSSTYFSQKYDLSAQEVAGGGVNSQDDEDQIHPVFEILDDAGHKTAVISADSVRPGLQVDGDREQLVYYFKPTEPTSITPTEYDSESNFTGGQEWTFRHADSAYSWQKLTHITFVSRNGASKEYLPQKFKILGRRPGRDTLYTIYDNSGYANGWDRDYRTRDDSPVSHPWYNTFDRSDRVETLRLPDHSGLFDEYTVVLTGTHEDASTPTDTMVEVAWIQTKLGINYGVQNIIVGTDDLNWQSRSVPCTVRLTVNDGISSQYYYITSGSDVTKAPKHWKVYASDDNVNWAHLHTNNSVVFTNINQEQVFAFKKLSNYKYYRFDFLENNEYKINGDDNYVQINSLDINTVSEDDIVTEIDERRADVRVPATFGSSVYVDGAVTAKDALYVSNTISANVLNVNDISLRGRDLATNIAETESNLINTMNHIRDRTDFTISELDTRTVSLIGLNKTLTENSFVTHNQRLDQSFTSLETNISSLTSLRSTQIDGTIRKVRFETSLSFIHLDTDIRSLVDFRKLQVDNSFRNIESEVHNSFGGLHDNVVSLVDFRRTHIDSTISKMKTLVGTSFIGLRDAAVSLISLREAQIDTTIQDLSLNTDSSFSNLHTHMVSLVKNTESNIRQTISNLITDIGTSFVNLHGNVATLIDLERSDVNVSFAHTHESLQTSISDLMRALVSSDETNTRNTNSKVAALEERRVMALSKYRDDVDGTLLSMELHTDNTVAAIRTVTGNSLIGLHDNIVSLVDLRKTRVNETISHLQTTVDNSVTDIENSLSGLRDNVASLVDLRKTRVNETISHLETTVENSVTDIENSLSGLHDNVVSLVDLRKTLLN